MPFNTQFIFPTSVYGQISDVYGTNITAYNSGANTTGFPSGAGLVLGQAGILFDGTVCNLLKANTTIVQFAAVTPVIGNGNFYTVTNTNSAAGVNALVGAANDRGGSNSLTSGSIAWMTTEGLGTVLVNASIAGGQFLVPSTTVGSLQAFVLATNIASNVYLLNASTTAGGYPVQFQ